MNNLDLSDRDILKLLESNIHEEKYVAAEIIAGKYESSLNQKIPEFYHTLKGVVCFGIFGCSEIRNTS